ncbi:MAG: hypothetical protein JOY90_30045 [Bradyrhizobium sp.]|uniref:hypothetical protein n=1 Tax=Bradyrhizobium sp. TaxID=376 RepID=UPI001D53C6DA|nr:hypothetical protein [Bradyrhizobium sp.]MBV9564654.1 hypothetical protein [Bradyrhizobium sp.]
MPLALGDMLWDVLVVQFAAFLDRLTLRKAIEFVVIAVLVMAFVQTLPIDIAILFAGDTLMYLEIALAIRLAAGRDFFVAAFRLAMRLARLAMHALRRAHGYTISRISRRREPQTRPRLTPSRGSDDPEADAGIAWGAPALA